jgi:hypothetical protein
MRALRCGSTIAFLLAFTISSTVGFAEQSTDEATVREVPCSAVGTVWPASESGPYELAAPQLSVVMTDFRPKDTPLYLDGRFIGRARYFNGKKGLLFLQPGLYRLEARSDGYLIDVFEIKAAPNCRFDIKHRMTRQRGAASERRDEPPGKGVPGQRVFGPLEKAPPPAAPPTRPRGADLSLRPELGSSAAPPASPRRLQASLKLRVRPETARVYLDDVFIATGAELESMVAPFAISSGPHQLRIEAPGFHPRSVSFEVSKGETYERELVLQRSGR